MSFSCVPLKPSQTGVVTPWLARRWTPQAAFTHWSGASLPTGDLIQSRGKRHTVRRLQHAQCTTPPWIWCRGVKTEGEPQNHKVPGLNIEIMEYLRKQSNLWTHATNRCCHLLVNQTGCVLCSQLTVLLPLYIYTPLHFGSRYCRYFILRHIYWTLFSSYWADWD